MILDTTIDLYTRTITLDSAGEQAETWAKAGTYPACVQPLAFNEAVVRTFGLTDLTESARKMFTPTTPAILVGCRVRHLGTDYEVRGKQPWPNHDEILLVPVQGVAHDG